jgi:hypothetical protein
LRRAREAPLARHPWTVFALHANAPKGFAKYDKNRAKSLQRAYNDVIDMHVKADTAHTMQPQHVGEGKR